MSSVIDLSKTSDRHEHVAASESTALSLVLERAARDQSIDIVKMRELWAIHKEMMALANKAAFNAAMADCQAQMPRIMPTFRNDSTNSLYAALEEIDRVARPIYTRHGFGLSFGTADCPLENYYRQTCEVSHRSGHSEMRHADLPLDNVGLKGNPNKTGIQGFGSTMSYGQRYITKLVFNIVVGGEDNDGNGQTALSPEQISQMIRRANEANVSIDSLLEFWQVKALGEIAACNFSLIMQRLDKAAKNITPRPDLSKVDTTLRDKRVSEIADLVAEYGSDENQMAEKFQQYHEAYLQAFPDLWISVHDKLAADGIMTKSAIKKLLPSKGR